MLRVATTMNTIAIGKRRVRNRIRNPATATKGSSTGVPTHQKLKVSPVEPDDERADRGRVEDVAAAPGEQVLGEHRDDGGQRDAAEARQVEPAAGR